MNIKAHFQDSAHDVTLTTDHAGSSYGIPVLVPGFSLAPYMPAACYGPGDLLNEPPLVLDDPATPEEIAAIKAAGFVLAM